MSKGHFGKKNFFFFTIWLQKKNFFHFKEYKKQLQISFISQTQSTPNSTELHHFSLAPQSLFTTSLAQTLSKWFIFLFIIYLYLIKQNIIYTWCSRKEIPSSSFMINNIIGFWIRNVEVLCSRIIKLSNYHLDVSIC